MCPAVDVATNYQGCNNILGWCSCVYSKLWNKTLASMICSMYRLTQGPAAELPSVVFSQCTRPALWSRPAWLNSPPGLKSVMQLPALGQNMDVRGDFCLRVGCYWFYLGCSAVPCRTLVPSSEHVGYVADNRLRSGLARQRLCLLAVCGGCLS